MMMRVSTSIFISSGQHHDAYNAGGAGEEEEYKGPDLDKMPEQKQYVPSLYEDENFDFKVAKPQLHGSHIVYHVMGVDK